MGIRLNRNASYQAKRERLPPDRLTRLQYAEEDLASDADRAPFQAGTVQFAYFDDEFLAIEYARTDRESAELRDFRFLEDT
ncbi:MAG: hypothetical protein M3295_00045 [Chloroflexota bacterium]|nr:hypothetical protein [Chloroflexota bacterium]